MVLAGMQGPLSGKHYSFRDIPLPDPLPTPSSRGEGSRELEPGSRRRKEAEDSRGLKPMRQVASCVLAFVLLQAVSGFAKDSFSTGLDAYQAGNFTNAAASFERESRKHPASGTFQNLGNAEWQAGRTAEAVLAWERALWLNPFDANAQNNLRFARDTAQLEAPELRWYEAGSTWLPRNFWAGLATLSIWLVAGMIVLPTVFRWRRAAWHQAVAALGLGMLLLSLPANLGVWTRSNLGFVMQKNVSLRLTPTAEGEAVTRLAAGEPGRLIRTRGKYLYIRTSRHAGWVERNQFELISPK